MNSMNDVFDDSSFEAPPEEPKSEASESVSNIPEVSHPPLHLQSGWDQMCIWLFHVQPITLCSTAR